MKLVVGLGNPGPRYETTRHNAGFLAADRLIDRWRARGPHHRGEAECWEATAVGERVLIIKPQTFMNLSGRAVAPIYRFHKCSPEDLIVLHDEVDLAPLVIRIKTGGGTAGHNGLKSLDQHLGAADTGYHRVRVGVGKGTAPATAPNEGSSPRARGTADHVLAPFTDDELKALDGVLDHVSDAVELLLQGRATEAMNIHNRKGN